MRLGDLRFAMSGSSSKTQANYVIRPFLLSSSNTRKEAVFIEDISNSADGIFYATEPALGLGQSKEEEEAPQKISKCDPSSGKFACSFDGCDKKYANPNHLKVHIRNHTGDRPFKCHFEGCGKSFTTSYSHKSHIRTHTNERPYCCPAETCDKKFKTSGDLQKHLRTHTGSKPFKCSVEGCEKSFTTSNILKTHIRVHTGERPYECSHPNCGKTFSSATNYQNHTRIHSGEKPFQCKFKNCGKRFTEYSSLYKHNSVHIISKPYSCNICPKTFRQSPSLAIHKKSAHGIDSSEGEILLDLQMDNEQSSGKIISIATGEGEMLVEKSYQPISITLDSKQIILLTRSAVD